MFLRGCGYEGGIVDLHNMETINTKRFVKKFQEISANEDRRFCFVLGAGASRSSGIKTGAELARTWLEELKKELEPQEYQTFLIEKKIDDAQPGYSYPAIYDERFKLDTESGFHRINSEMEVATPGYGYSVLSQILSEHRHNIIITTNFDTLSEEALYTYTSKRPLVCGHELLADFAKPSINRPLIIKIHRDRFLGPKSTQEETEKISKQWVDALNNIFLNCIPVFIGYGGNDGSLMNYLLEIKQFSNIFWCEMKGAKLAEPVIELLEKHSGKLVEIDGFDELMFWLQDGLNLPVLNKKIETVARERSEKYWEVFKQIKDKYAESNDSDEQAAAERLVEKVDENSWWKWQLMINEAKDPKEKESLYVKAITQMPNSVELHGNYALFLEHTLHDNQRTKNIYKKALQIAPTDIVILGNYATFLYKTVKDYDEAEIHYKIALKVNPSDTNCNTNYGAFLADVRKDIYEAEKYLKAATNIEPNNIEYINNYAYFLHKEAKKYNLAEKYYKRALQISPDDVTVNMNYVMLLRDMRKSHNEIERYFNKILALMPDKAFVRTYYGNYLRDIKKLELAEEQYKIALDLQPTDPLVNCDYANYLVINGNIQSAEKHLLIAMEYAPDNAISNGNYALFLQNVKKDKILAEKFYLKALQIDSSNANNNGNYGGFLLAQGKKEESNGYIITAEVKCNQDDLRTELLFYRYAHFEENRNKHLADLKRIICSGVRSLNFNLQDNVDRAIQDGHPEPELLQRLADIITKDEPVGDLCEGINNVNNA